ncbi:hypothetical protein E1287_25700 [Actinomadura sp. KC06]|uniref:hypothetical protein n=1 Tax=Actinomadura sp. KC06 TaxID=2530369 RepID=UPI00104712F0|nr:hypothetical protein [Actinomadura sp. KC06]TDD31658.1 hypothetical protein E1287_25700 [Actinomadura sp. KC06]
MTRNPHLTEQDREQLVDLLAARIRDSVSIRLGRSALGTTRPGEPIGLSGGEADTAARAALAALDDHASREVRHYAPTQDAYDAACKALHHHRQRADEAERRAAELEAEGVDQMAERLLDDTRMRALQIRDGTAELEVEPARELAAIWVGVARTMLAGGENYSETPVEFEVGLAGERERYALIVQRVGKVTPHQARKAAEERADSAEREIERLRQELSRTRAAHATDHPDDPLDVLRAAVQTETGPWTSQRAQAALTGATRHVRGQEARRLLNQLADEGLLRRPSGKGQPWGPVLEEVDA